MIDMQEPVALTFALRYLNSFAKATPLSPSVRAPTRTQAQLKELPKPWDFARQPPRDSMEQLCAFSATCVVFAASQVRLQGNA